MNKAILIGHVGVNPSIEYLANGNACINFTVATKARSSNKPDDWHQIVAYSSLAEKAYLAIKVGQLVSIEGYVRTVQYPHGNLQKIMISKAEVVMDSFTVLKPSSKEEAN